MDNLFGAPEHEWQIRRSGHQGPGKKIPGHPGPQHPMYGQAYQNWYSPSRLPAKDDPGWIKGDASFVRKIRIHGPFDVETDNGDVLEHCVDGFLGVDDTGKLVVLPVEGT